MFACCPLHASMSIGHGTSCWFVGHRKWWSVEGTGVDEVVLNVKSELACLDHAHANNCVDSKVWSDGNFEGSWRTLGTEVGQVVFNNCLEDRLIFSIFGIWVVRANHV
jgi:hypothetical protein